MSLAARKAWSLGAQKPAKLMAAFQPISAGTNSPAFARAWSLAESALSFHRFARTMPGLFQARLRFAHKRRAARFGPPRSYREKPASHSGALRRWWRKFAPA